MTAKDSLMLSVDQVFCLVQQFRCELPYSLVFLPAPDSAEMSTGSVDW